MSGKKICLLLAGGIFLVWLNLVQAGGVYEAWMATYQSPGQVQDLPKDMVVDDSGNIYVTGLSQDFEFVTLKYKPDGTLLWSKIFDTHSPDRGACCISLEQTGGFYIAGTAYSAVGESLVVVKYDADGDTLWARYYRSGIDKHDVAVALAVDDSGNALVAGHSFLDGDHPEPSDIVVVKYSPAGDTLWLRKYGTALAVEKPAALVTDLDGSVYVAGYAGANLLVLKYSSRGDLLWTRSEFFGKAKALALDESYNLVVTAEFKQGQNPADFLTVKYNPDGDTIWTRIYSHPSGYDDSPTDLKLDLTGNIYIAGYSLVDGAYDYVFTALKYQSDGTLLWSRQFDSQPAATADKAKRLTLDPSGNVYIIGDGSAASLTANDYLTVGFSDQGDFLWSKIFNGPYAYSDNDQAIATDNSGNLYVTGWIFQPSSQSDIATVKYSPCTEASPLAGDANGSGTYTLADILALVNYVFNKPNYPSCTANSSVCWISGNLCQGNWDPERAVNLTDVLYAVRYIFPSVYPPLPFIPYAIGNCCLTLP